MMLLICENMSYTYINKPKQTERCGYPRRRGREGKIGENGPISEGTDRKLNFGVSMV